MAKSIAVLGLGKFGMSLVRGLNEMGADVLAVDKVEANVKEIAASCASAVCADLSNEENLLKLGLEDMDSVVIAMGESLEPSILSVAVSKELGVPMIVAKSSSKRMSSILLKVGANRVIMPEEYAGMRSAALLVSDNITNYFQVSDQLSMIEMKKKEKWVGKSLINLSIRQKYKVIIVGKKDKTGWVPIDPEEPLQADVLLLAVMDRKNMGRFLNT